MGPFTTLAELAKYNVGPADIGHLAYVSEDRTWYEAKLPGLGLDRFEPSMIGGQVAGSGYGRVQAYRRTFDHADTDIAVADTSVAIDFGDALPVGAIVLAVIADITQDWSDGGAGVFGADVGVSGGDADLYTPTELNIDGGVALQTQFVGIPASGVQLAVTITGDVNLDTLTTGTMVLTVLYMVPQVTEIAAP